MSSRQRILLFIMLAAGLALRVGWTLRQANQVDANLPDQFEYLSLGKNLVAGNGFYFHDARFNQDVHAYRMPGYPLFIAALGADVRAVRLLQCLIDASTALAMFLLARRWMPTGRALFAMALVAFNPFLIYFSALLLTETVFIAMLAWGMALLPTRRGAPWGGGLAGLAVALRPSALLLAWVLPLVAWRARRAAAAGRASAGAPETGAIRLWPAWTAGIGVSIGVFAACALRASLALGHPSLPVTDGGITAYDGFNPAATGASDQSFLASPRFAEAAKLEESARDRYFQAEARSWVVSTFRTDPMRLVRLTLAKVGRTWSPVPLSAEYGGRQAYTAIAALWAVPLDLLVLAGLCRRGLPRPIKLFLLAPAVYFTLIHAASVGSLRYRLGAEPPMALLAACALAPSRARAPEIRRAEPAL